ncbi:MAG TPA: MSMEG_4193 family putative phosphomutase [Anaerolineae bacterium]|nr:MSMEG_4193 family putative phosphomutase [Anaerolineae bacterium]
MTILFIIRHGHTDWADKKLAGWLPDVHLSEAGVEQADALVERLAPVKLDAIFSSPLERTLETAAPLARARNLKVAKVPDLGEVKYGDWQGRPLSQLTRKKEWATLQHAPSLMRFPNGESILEMQTRAVAATQRIAAENPKRTIALFSHGDVIKAVVAHYIGMPLDAFQRLTIAPASVTVLAVGPSFARLMRMNDTGPFQPPSKDGHRR